MAKYIIYPWAISGTRAPIPELAQPSGSVSWTDGFTIDYTLDPNTNPNGKPVPLAGTNQYLFDLSSGLQQYQQFGIPAFITTADNGGTPFPYSVNAIVRYSNVLYISTINSNVSLPTVVPDWVPLNAQNFAFNKPARVIKTADQSIGSSAIVVTFNSTPDFDPNGIFDSSNNSFKPTVPGYFQFYASLRSTSVPTINPSEWEINVFKSSTTAYKMDVEFIDGADQSIGGMIQLPMNGTTDFMQLRANIAAGTVNAGVQSYFGCSFVSSF